MMELKSESLKFLALKWKRKSPIELAFVSLLSFRFDRSSLVPFQYIHADCRGKERTNEGEKYPN